MKMLEIRWRSSSMEVPEERRGKNNLSTASDKAQTPGVAETHYPKSPIAGLLSALYKAIGPAHVSQTSRDYRPVTRKVV